MFFFSAGAAADQLELTLGLYEKGRWELCRRECRRALLTDPDNAPHFQLLEALSDQHSGGEPVEILAKLDALIAADTDTKITAAASYEKGRLHWLLDQPEDALHAFEQTFYTTGSKELFLRSSCSMFQLMNDNKFLKEDREALISQINTSREEWYGRLFTETAKPEPADSRTEQPNWLVRFYRSQISPAIGNRCTLQPSCSEYFQQAQQKHGWASIPMIADRFCREPEVNSLKKHPVVTPTGRIRYGDPLENHDFWMKDEK